MDESYDIEKLEQENELIPMSRRRYELCKTCDDFTIVKICKLCGCFMPLKVRLYAAQCPQNKW